MSGQSTQSSLAKATLVEVTLAPQKPPQPVPGGKNVTVDFNPQTLKLTFSNENKSGNQTGSASQFVGAGTSKLAVELLFDTSQTGSDVRATTNDIAYFIRPDPNNVKQGNQPKRVPPGCQFQWGTFSFRGVVDSLTETLDYFSEDGVPLRSTLALGMSGIDTMVPKPAGAGAPATSPQTQAPANTPLQKMAGADGGSANWKGIAAANNIDDPLRIPPGTPLNMSPDLSGGVGASAIASGGASAGFSAGLGAGVGFAAGAGVSAGIGGGVSAGVGGGISAGVGGGISAGVGGGISAGVGGGVSAGFGASAGAGASASAAASANLGVSASAGVAASGGLGLSAGIGGVVGLGAPSSAVVGARTNAAGSAGGSFGVSASAGVGASAGIGVSAGVGA